MRITRPKSYTRYNSSNFQNNFSKTSSNFFKVKNNKITRLFSGNNFGIKFRPKLFSLLDINDKITNSRGTSLPIQFKRLSEEETKRQFGFSYREDQNTKLALIKDFLNNMHPSKYKCKQNNQTKTSEEDCKKSTKNINEGNNNNKKIEIKIDNNNKDSNVNENKNKEKIENKKENNNDNTKNNNKKRIVSKAKTQPNEEKLKIRNRNDYWLPEGYSKYELLVNNPKLLLKQIKSDPFAGNLPEFKLKNIKKRSYDSDIFFSKPATKKECSYNKIIKQHNHQISDIFNVDYKVENLMKTSEKFLFKRKTKDYYYLTRESNSKWEPKVSIPTFLNSPSVDYNILSPGKKNFGLTKEKIITEIEKNKKKNAEEKKLDKKISESVNYMNPIYRQKGLSEFIDITRNGGNNPGKDFINCYTNNPRCFFKNDETCSTFYNSYVFYKDLCNKPFILDPSLKLK
jgi:hypothetical protein